MLAKRKSDVNLGVAGLGGFASEHHTALESLEDEGKCRVLGACDPDHERLLKEDTHRLSERGVAVLPSLQTLLADHGKNLHIVTLPTPIPLHAEQHRAVVEAGVACYLEKPPTLWWPEYRSMIDTETAAARATQVGFNFVADPLRRTLKSRILSGEFGRLERASLLAVWPRSEAYYMRSPWAGRLFLADRPVLDSCLGNAQAHYVQNLLFWCGEGALEEVGKVVEVQGWLARAHRIQSYDTVCVRAITSSRVELLIAATHAAEGKAYDVETIRLQKAEITFDSWRSATIRWEDGRTESYRSKICDHLAMLKFNLQSYISYVLGGSPRPPTTLLDCEGFVALCDLALISGGTIIQIDSQVSFNDPGFRTVKGLGERLLRFARSGEWPNGEPIRVSMDNLDDLSQTTVRLAR